MKLNLLNREKTEVAGLDIGSAAVKLVRLNKTADGYTLISAAKVPITAGSKDAKEQRKHGVEAIRACLRKTGLKDKNVVCGVSGPEVVVRGFTFPPLPDAAVEQAVRMEAQQVCPLDIQLSVLDFQLIETPPASAAAGTKNASARKGVMTVATKNIIRQQTDMVTAAGAKPIMVDVNALALLNCLNELAFIEDAETVAVIDVGRTLTNVIVYGTDGLPFVRNINIAGKQIVDGICKQTELSADEVRKALQDSASEADKTLLLAMNNAIAPLVNAINETLRFYSFQEKSCSVDRIFLCGSFTLIDVFVDFLTDAMATPVKLLNPFSVIQYDPDVSGNETLEKDGPAFAVAAGLAMRTL